MSKIINIENNLKHKVSEVICVQCGHRWIATRPSQTLLKQLECPNCNEQGYTIETGEKNIIKENVMNNYKEIENKEELLKQISKELYDNEFFIDNAILTYRIQQEKTYTFFRDDSADNILYKYNWCQRPCDTNMSLCQFDKNANVCCWMSESLAERHGLKQITLNEFMFDFVKSLIEENIKLKKLLEENNAK